MKFQIDVRLLRQLPRIAYRRGADGYEGVVAHATAVYEDSDQGEAAYMARNWQNAFVHYFVDHDSITQAAPFEYAAWGAGPAANARFVHVELCQTRDAAKFREAYTRYVWLIAWLLQRRGLGVTDRGSLWSHADVSRLLGGTDHTDPLGYLAEHGVSWPQFVADVQALYAEIEKGGAESQMSQQAQQIADLTSSFAALVEEVHALERRVQTLEAERSAQLDQTVGEWAVEAVERCRRSGAMIGEAGKWNPKQPVTREMLAVILHRIGAIERQ